MHLFSLPYLFHFVGWFVQNLRKKFQDALADAGTAAEEAISSIRTVRSFVGEDKAYNSYSNEIQNSYGHGKNMAIATGVFNGLIGSVSQVSVIP